MKSPTPEKTDCWCFPSFSLGTQSQALCSSMRQSCDRISAPFKERDDEYSCYSRIRAYLAWRSSSSSPPVTVFHVVSACVTLSTQKTGKRFEGRREKMRPSFSLTFSRVSQFACSIRLSDSSSLAVLSGSLARHSPSGENLLQTPAEYRSLLTITQSPRSSSPSPDPWCKLVTNNNTGTAEAAVTRRS